MATTNEQLMNQIRENASSGYADVMPEATATNGADLLRVITEYPTIRNEFINTLVNKVIRTEFFSRAYRNPLSFLHKGTLEYGSSIEQLFVRMAEKKNFGEKFGSGASEADSLISKEESHVDVNYIVKNFAYKWKASISETQLRTAFTSSTGLTQLVNQIVESTYSNMYYTQFQDMKGVLLRDGVKKSNGTLSNGLLGDINAITESDRTMVVPVPSGDIKFLAEKIRAFSDRLQFISCKYNLNKVPTHSNPSQLVLFTTPEIKSKLDINILAFAFNIDKASISERIILLDELGTVKGGTGCSNPEEENEVLGILADVDLVQYYTTLEDSRTFENGDTLSYNLFLHNQGICAKCDFVNSIVFRAQ